MTQEEYQNKLEHASKISSELENPLKDFQKNYKQLEEAMSNFEIEIVEIGNFIKDYNEVSSDYKDELLMRDQRLIAYINSNALLGDEPIPTLDSEATLSEAINGIDYNEIKKRVFRSFNLYQSLKNEYEKKFQDLENQVVEKLLSGKISYDSDFPDKVIAAMTLNQNIFTWLSTYQAGIKALDNYYKKMQKDLNSYKALIKDISTLGENVQSAVNYRIELLSTLKIKNK